MSRCGIFVEIQVLIVVDSDRQVASRDRQTLPRVWELGRTVAFASIPDLNENAILCATGHLLDTSTTWAWKSNVNLLHSCWDMQAHCQQQQQGTSGMTRRHCQTARCAWETFSSRQERSMTNPCHAGALNLSKYPTLFNNYSLRGEMPQTPHFRHTSKQ